MENPIKMDDLGVPLLFLETPISMIGWFFCRWMNEGDASWWMGHRPSSSVGASAKMGGLFWGGKFPELEP